MSLAYKQLLPLGSLICTDIYFLLFSQGNNSIDDLSAVTLNLLIYPPDIPHY